MEEAWIGVVAGGAAAASVFLYWWWKRQRAEQDAVAALYESLVSRSALQCPVGNTALIVAALRARESKRPPGERLFVDEYAARLGGEHGAQMAQLCARVAPVGAAIEQFLFGGRIALRTRFYDDEILRAVATLQGPARQVVVVGAGLDTRALRLAWPPETVVFELDREEVLRFKNARLPPASDEGAAGAGAGAARRVCVSAELAEPDWATRLRAAGFRAGEPTVWLMEGLLVYLPPDAALALVSKASELSAAGSWLLCDLSSVHPGRVHPMLHRLGFQFQFRCEDPARFLRSAGWALHCGQSAGELAVRYGRWPACIPSFVARLLPRASLYLVAAHQRQPGPTPPACGAACATVSSRSAGPGDAPSSSTPARS